MKRLIAALVLLTAIAQPVAAQAPSPIYWSSIATACTPDRASIQSDRYQSPNDSIVALRPGVLDPVILICGVTPNAAANLPNAISLTSFDTTGAAADAFVKASLIRVNRNTGGRAVVVTVTSNATGTRKQLAGFNSPLNFETFYYYVRIDMDRAAANQTIRSIGVALETQRT